MLPSNLFFFAICVQDSDDHIIILGLCCQGLLVLAGQSVVHKFLWFVYMFVFVIMCM